MREKVRLASLFVIRHLPIDNGNGREISKISAASKVTTHSAKESELKGAADKFCFMGFSCVGPHQVASKDHA